MFSFTSIGESTGSSDPVTHSSESLPAGDIRESVIWYSFIKDNKMALDALDSSHEYHIIYRLNVYLKLERINKV